ncbi:MAG: MerR family transcriptional regulator [Trueperaceae bacterium]
MQSLNDLAASRPTFDLEGFVREANQLLPEFLPDDPVDARVKGEVNGRLVRHYTSSGLLEPPLKEGREARYTVDHLLQLLALRRLLADGVSAAAIGQSLRQKDRYELSAIIEGGAKLDFAPATDHRSAALSFIEEIRQRSSEGPALSVPPPTPKGEPRPSTPAATPTGNSWERYQLLDGVELHVRSDVKVPAKPEAQRRLLDHITRLIIQIGQRRMR